MLKHQFLSQLEALHVRLETLISNFYKIGVDDPYIATTRLFIKETLIYETFLQKIKNN